MNESVYFFFLGGYLHLFHCGMNDIRGRMGAKVRGFPYPHAAQQEINLGMWTLLLFFLKKMKEFTIYFEKQDIYSYAACQQPLHISCGCAQNRRVRKPRF